VKDYDLDQTGKAIKGLFTGIAFMAFLVRVCSSLLPALHPVPRWPRPSLPAVPKAPADRSTDT
jgi:hypothetical protein